MLILPREKFICLTFVSPYRKMLREEDELYSVGVRLFVVDEYSHEGVMTTMEKLCLV